MFYTLEWLYNKRACVCICIIYIIWIYYSLQVYLILAGFSGTTTIEV